MVPEEPEAGIVLMSAQRPKSAMRAWARVRVRVRVRVRGRGRCPHRNQSRRCCVPVGGGVGEGGG